jgi:two-component system chemotaxis response regulator CheB
MNEPKHIIVIGASAGGLPVILSLVSTLRTDLDAAIFIVLHISKTAIAEVILQTIQKKTTLTCVVPLNNDEIKRGCLYLAPADHHLFLKKGTIAITYGPTENRFRPSIDVLFRSAAAAYAWRVTGIILTGLLDDGTSGMDAIKRSGGTCIVQEPSEAEFDSMPTSVLKNVDVDYQVSVNDMPFVLEDIFSRKVDPNVQVPEDVAIEAGITGDMTSAISKLALIGEHSNYSCPDCGGNLWKITHDRVPRYRCHTGHAYTEKTLLEKQEEVLVESLWVSIRMMEQQRNLLLALIAKKNSADTHLAALNERAEQMKIHIERLKVVVLTLGSNRQD